ncbi:lipocalin-like domain-containing protein [Flavobacterium pectinovorum]|uniref:lipocalin-like domain-containing protein n=1 Tax=Flavobacterium pectinovorum TaxID=29533 RepID=UPI00265ECDC5|nr:lipocalin-like domain-containing protein [Flavobacterium pectinovorum]WKL46460.1 lipocalin-like domain-containing protein [Flavobacterium pectinovorum]
MKKLKTVAIVLFIANITFAQKIEKTFIGTWKLISVENTNADGTKTFPYETNPKGLLFLDDKGNYAVQIYKNERLKIISGDKNKCTPEENAAIVQGSNSHFGKYEIDDSTETITFKIETASFPNWEQTEQKRSYKYNNGQLEYIVVNTTQGGKSVTAKVVWKKLQ